MATVYILHSKSKDLFYIGSCKNLEERLSQHNSSYFKDSYTSKATDWEIFFTIDNLSLTQARKIELHIKKMKSRKYKYDLKLYPEMSKRLKEKYGAGSSR